MLELLRPVDERLELEECLPLLLLDRPLLAPILLLLLLLLVFLVGMFTSMTPRRGAKRLGGTRISVARQGDTESR